MKNWEFNPLLNLFNPFNYFNEPSIFLVKEVKLVKGRRNEELEIQSSS